MNKKIYFIALGLLSVLMLFSSGMYLFDNTHVVEEFVKLGFPVYIIYPLAGLKILGLVAIWSRKNIALKEWAYAGFFFDFILAGSAHIMSNDGEFFGAVIAMLLLAVTYWYDKKVFGCVNQNGTCEK